MGRTGKRTSVERTQHKNYRAVADNFLKGAELARDFEYWNAAGALIVHAAIAYSDALSIKFGGMKSQSENHLEAVQLLTELVADSEKKRSAIHQLQRIIDHKTSVSYSGEMYSRKDIEQLWKQLQRFKEWTDTLLD